jgi:hypothetical protein
MRRPPSCKRCACPRAVTSSNSGLSTALFQTSVLSKHHHLERSAWVTYGCTYELRCRLVKAYFQMSRVLVHSFQAGLAVRCTTTPVVQQFDCTISEQQRIVHELVLYDRTRLFSRTPSRTVRTANRTPNRTVRSYTAVQSYIQKYCTIVCQSRNRVVQTLPNTSQIACSAQKMCTL